jgi:hypothetical protein
MVHRYKIQQNKGEYCLKGCDDGDLVDYSSYAALEARCRRLDETLTEMEQPSMIGPALTKRGDKEAAPWDRGWDAAVRHMRGAFTLETKGEQG